MRENKRKREEIMTTNRINMLGKGKSETKFASCSVCEQKKDSKSAKVRVREKVEN